MWTVLFLSAIFLFQNTLGDLIVQLPDGKVQGTTIDTPSGATYYAWRGIPYAKPPLGKLRYLPPVKAEPWDDILDASQDSPACTFFGTFPDDPQPLNGQSEDCLYINVYSPLAVGSSNSTVNSNLSVIFWIYGGGFISGTGDFGFYGPTPFLEENVIFITFNYRLGIFGFISTEDDVILGNAGLKDQLLALHWVKDNIAFFGGNPSDITIYGESAGGISVGHHIVSPKSRNLFKGAILESGTTLFTLIQSDARKYAFTLANRINSSITNSSTSAEVRDVLQGAPADLIVNLTKGERALPVIEIKTNSSFLTEPIYETLASGDVAKVPIVIGFNSEEALNFLVATKDALIEQAKNIDSNREILVPDNMPLKENASTKAIGEEIHEYYVGKNGLFLDNLAACLEWFSDNRFTRAIYKHALLQSKFAPVYMYQISYYGSLSKKNFYIPGVGRVGHAQELGYLFNVSTRHLETDKDYLTRRRLVKLWSNFAKTSNPTPDADALLENVKWEPITEDNVHYLDIDENLEVKPSRKSNESIFWDHLWNKYADHPYNTF